jgi:hypothetical protein
VKSLIIFFFRNEELGWMDDETNDELRGMNGKDDHPRILYK